mmetsp:Transcript_93100/g.265908  ORF Transcript_93100/g.265908 Transcript_93100/m.265908 type:complete len:1401 (+) Transcript_93100:104-4306(+)
MGRRSRHSGSGGRTGGFYGGGALMMFGCATLALVRSTSAIPAQGFSNFIREPINQELEAQLAAVKRLVELQVSAAATELNVNGSDVLEDVQRKLLFSAIQTVKSTKGNNFVKGLSTSWAEGLQSDYNCSFWQYQNYNKSYSSGYTYTFATTKYDGCKDTSVYTSSSVSPKFVGDTSTWDADELCMKYYDVDAAGRPTDLLAFENFMPCTKDWYLDGSTNISWTGPFQYSEDGLLGLAFSMPMTTPEYMNGKKSVGVSTAFTLISAFEDYIQDNYGDSGQAYFEQGALAGSQNGTVYLMDLPSMNASWVQSEVMLFDTSLTWWTDSWRLVIVESVACMGGYQPDVSAKGEEDWPSPSQTTSGGQCMACEAGKALDLDSVRIGEIACQMCLAGTYSGNSYSKCETCAAGFWSGDNATSCTKCVAVGSTSSVASSGCDECLPGYHWNLITDQCDACPFGVTCLGGKSQPLPRKGFWASDDYPVTSEYLFECGGSGDQCDGNFSCALGVDGSPKFSGRMCSVVAEGYFPIAGSIWTCPTTEHGRWIQGALLFIVLMAIWVWFNTVLIVDYDSFDMFMQAVQNCALIYEFGFVFHDSLRAWLDPILGIALFDLGIIHFKCIDQRWDFVWAFWLQMSVVFVWAFFEIVAWLVSTGLHAKHTRSFKEQAEIDEAKQKVKERLGILEISEDEKHSSDMLKSLDINLNKDPDDDGLGFFSTKRWFEGAKDKTSRFCEGRDKAIGRILLVVDSSHATICLYAVKVLPFFCTEYADGNSYLDADPDFKCYTNSHYYMVAMGLCMLCLVGISYPIACASYVLHYFRDYDIKDGKTKKNYFNERLANRLGFQLDCFRGPMIAWNGFIISKQVALIAIGAAFRLFNKSYHFVQGVLGIVVLLVNVLASAFCRPYVRMELNNLEIFYVVNEAMFLCFGFLFSSLHPDSHMFDVVYYLVLVQFIGMAAAGGSIILIDFSTSQINKRLKRTFATNWEKDAEQTALLLSAATAGPTLANKSALVIRGSLHELTHGKLDPLRAIERLPASVKKAAKAMTEFELLETLRNLPKETQEKLKKLPEDAQAIWIAAAHTAGAAGEEAAAAALEAGKHAAEATATTLVTMNKAVTELVTGEYENEGPMTDDELVYVYALVSAINGPHLRKWFAKHYGTSRALFCNESTLDRSVFVDFENLAIQSKINDVAFSEKSIFSPYHKLSRNATSHEAIFWHDLIDCFPGIIDWVLYELDTERKRRQVLLIFKSLQRYVEQFGKDDGSYDGAGRDSGCCKKDTRGGRGRLALRIQKHHRAPLLFKLLESEDLMADGPATPGKGNQLSYVELMKLFLIRLGDEEEDQAEGLDVLQRSLSDNHKVKWVHKDEEWKQHERQRRAAEEKKRRDIEDQKRRENLEAVSCHAKVNG